VSPYGPLIQVPSHESVSFLAEFIAISSVFTLQKEPTCIKPTSFISRRIVIDVEFIFYRTIPTDPMPQQRETSLSQNYPNPVFHGQTTFIRFTLPARQWATVTVYDALGREVSVLSRGLCDAGEHVKQFEVQDLPGGIYTFVLRSGNVMLSKRAVVVL
jgi:hypothetical protein